MLHAVNQPFVSELAGKNCKWRIAASFGQLCQAPLGVLQGLSRQASVVCAEARANLVPVRSRLSTGAIGGGGGTFLKVALHALRLWKHFCAFEEEDMMSPFSLK